MLPRFSHHTSLVLNHTDPINPQHGLQCMADTSPFTITAGQEALCCDQYEFSLQSGMCEHKPDCSCPAGATWRHQIVLLWQRVSKLANLGLLFSAAVCERHTGACTKVSTLVQDRLRNKLTHFTVCISKKTTFWHNLIKSSLNKMKIICVPYS